MAKNMFKKYTESKVREFPVASGTGSGVLVLHPVSNQVGVTLTGRGDYTKSYTLPDGSVLSGIPAGGVGNRVNGAACATDGSWLFAIAGIVNGDTNAVSGGGTPSGTPVYRVASDGTLTLTVGSNVKIGVIDDGFVKGGIAPVLIGTNL